MRHAFGLLLLASVAGAQSSDFSGTWVRVVDTASARPSVASVGDAAFPVGDMGNGWGSPLTIAQRADSVIVSYVFFAPYDLQPPVRMAFAANGAESINDVILSHTTTRLRSKLTQRGDTLVVSTHYPSPVGAATEVIHTLTLEAPGTLVVAATRRGASGSPGTIRTTYTRR